MKQAWYKLVSHSLDLGTTLRKEPIVSGGSLKLTANLIELLYKGCQNCVRSLFVNGNLASNEALGPRF